MNEETKVFDEIENQEVNDTVDAVEETGGGFLGLIALAAVTIGTGAAAWWYKKSGKADERRIKKLEAKGYTVTAPEAIDDGVERVEIDRVDVK